MVASICSNTGSSRPPLLILAADVINPTRNSSASVSRFLYWLCAATNNNDVISAPSHIVQQYRERKTFSIIPRNSVSSFNGARIKMVSNVRYRLIGKKFRHKWLSRQSQHLTEQKYTDIHHGHRTDQPRYANVAQLTNDR